MTDINAKIGTNARGEGRVVDKKGRVLEFSMDDSWESWKAITRWNWQHYHWRSLFMNLRDMPRHLRRR